MKSLRIHFFNRHGIDLDNPGPNAPSSLLLALDASNAGNYLPSIALAAAAAAAAANSANAANSALSMAANNNSNSVTAYSDSGDSLQVCLWKFDLFTCDFLPFFIVFFSHSNSVLFYRCLGFIEIE